MKKKKYTIDDAIKEVKRELKMRKKVYPDWIVRNKLNKDRAYNQYWALEKALFLLEEKASEKTGVQKKLF